MRRKNHTFQPWIQLFPTSWAFILAFIFYQSFVISFIYLSLHNNKHLILKRVLSNIFNFPSSSLSVYQPNKKKAKGGRCMSLKYHHNSKLIKLFSFFYFVSPQQVYPELYKIFFSLTAFFFSLQFKGNSIVLVPNSLLFFWLKVSVFLKKNFLGFLPFNQFLFFLFFLPSSFDFDAMDLLLMSFLTMGMFQFCGSLVLKRLILKNWVLAFSSEIGLFLMLFLFRCFVNP